MAGAIALKSTTGQTATISFNGTVDKSIDASTLDQMIGVGQTWQDVTASRALGTTYTNTTGKPIQIAVSTASTTYVNMTITVNAVTVGIIYTYNSAGSMGQAIVPNGATYSVTGNTALTRWVELR